MRHSKFKWIKGTTNTYKTNQKNTDKRLKKKMEKQNQKAIFGVIQE